MDTMQQHTAEPWEVHGKEVRSGGFTVAAIPQRSMAAVGKFRYAELQETDATNARRIVACVNELSGVHEVTGYVHRLEDQRDKLLEALKSLMDDNTGGTWGLPASHKDTIAARAIIAEIEAAK